MTWTNISSIRTDKNWFYSPVFTGDSIRIRHVLSVYPDQLPWRFYGLIAQVFNYPDAIELFNVRRLYPSNQHTVLVIPNPFPNRERRIAIRGQKRYRTPIVWTAFIDVWNQEIFSLNSLENSLNELSQSLENSSNQQLQEIEEIVAEVVQDSEVQQEEFPWGYYF